MERKLTNRKRKFSKGRAIRVSDLVYETLDLKRRRNRWSWDVLLRKMLGLPDRMGNGQMLIEGMLEINSGVFLLKMPAAEWPEVEETAHKLAERVARQRRLGPYKAPLKMREIIL